jgi:hypothetical protein
MDWMLVMIVVLTLAAMLALGFAAWSIWRAMK